ncbi:MAG: hypothetical protein HY900_03460 [Deltaproteobacteria bacterium]|nr:hypothetical protein [Deltaproteobacteria bacterium]
MEVFVDGEPVDILPGMTVRHALLAAGLWAELDTVQVYDEWGNVLGLDGALEEGTKLFVRSAP